MTSRISRLMFSSMGDSRAIFYTIKPLIRGGNTYCTLTTTSPPFYSFSPSRFLKFSPTTYPLTNRRFVSSTAFGKKVTKLSGGKVREVLLMRFKTHRKEEDISEIARVLLIPRSAVSECITQAEEIPLTLKELEEPGKIDDEVLKEKVYGSRNKSKMRFRIFAAGITIITGIATGVIGKLTSRVTSLTEDFFYQEVDNFRVRLNIDEITNSIVIPRNGLTNANFKEIIIKIEDTFSTSTKGVSIVALVGPAGSGKTSVAESYAVDYEERVNSDPGLLRTKTVYTLDAHDENMLRRQYLDFARKLKITSTDLLESIDIEKDDALQTVIHLVNKKLLRRPGWLLIFKNVGKYQDIEKYIPKKEGFAFQRMQGKCLLTINPESAQSLPLSISQLKYQLSFKECLELFERVLDLKYLGEHLALKEQLIRQLQYLPPFIIQKAISLKSLPRDTFTKELLTLVSKPINETPKQVKEDTNAMELIEFLGLINNTGFGFELLKKWWEHTGKDSTKLYDTVDLLLNYNYIKQAENGLYFKNRIFYEKHSVSIFNPVILFFLDDKVFPKALLKYGSVDNANLIDHLESAVASFSQTISNRDNQLEERIENKITALLKISNFYLERDALIEAEGFCTHIIKLFREKSQETAEEIPILFTKLAKFGPEVPSLYAKALHYLGKNYFQQGEYDKAKKYAIEAIEMRKEIDAAASKSGEASAPYKIDSIIFRRQGHGWLLAESKKAEELNLAVELYKGLIKEENFPFNHMYCHIQLARTYRNLANVVLDTNHYATSENHLKQSIKMAEVEKEYRVTSVLYLFAGKFYFDPKNPKRDFSKARDYFSKVLESPEKHKTNTVGKAFYYLAKIGVEEYVEDSNKGKNKEEDERRLLLIEETIRESFSIYYDQWYCNALTPFPKEEIRNLKEVLGRLKELRREALLSGEDTIKSYA